MVKGIYYIFIKAESIKTVLDFPIRKEWSQRTFKKTILDRTQPCVEPHNLGIGKTLLLMKNVLAYSTNDKIKLLSLLRKMNFKIINIL